MVEEKAASFYLGKEYDVATRQIQSQTVMYDARDLTTHAVCLGMTGSGKTGLALVLLEEAAMDGIPCILIDPKGDLGNLLLTFPQLRAEDFQPWVNADDARRKGMEPDAYAEQMAQTWSKGLAQWDQTPERIQRLREACEFVIYTPGSDAGIPVSILQTFEVPSLSWDTDAETIREKIQSTVSSLLGLVGIDADPIRSREHVLLSNLFEHAWRAGEDLDLAKLIQRIQNPPMRQVGLFDVDTFFPPKDRLTLAMALNNLIAAPGFGNWLEGQPLDIEHILYRDDGKPRVSIFYISHLSDAERMFFVTLLLGQVQAWMRRQSGTTSLRCLVYFDELHGYFPPHPANPPSKGLLLRLMKEARAFGVGMFLATQNPVDLDYKGLTNAGTWFIGKLQTDRDKMRVLEGLETVDAAAGIGLNRADYDRLITSLEQRVFILHNVHEPKPRVFMTRWALSYLRGPLTRVQIRTLMEDLRSRLRGEKPSAGASIQTPSGSGLSEAPPRLDPSVAQHYILAGLTADKALRDAPGLSPAMRQGTGAQLVYHPHLFAWATVGFDETASGRVRSEDLLYLLPPPDESSWVDWQAGKVSVTKDDLVSVPVSPALYSAVPASLSDTKRLKALQASFQDFVAREEALPVFYNPVLKLYSLFDESEGRFVQRCQEYAAARQKVGLEKMRSKIGTERRRLEDRLQREQRELDQDQVKMDGYKREELLSAGETLLGMLTGRKRTSVLSGVSRRRRLTAQSEAQVKESKQTIAELQKQLAALDARELEEERALEAQATEMAREIEQVLVRPKKANIRVTALGIGWAPFWQVQHQGASGTLQATVVPAFHGQGETQ